MAVLAASLLLIALVFPSGQMSEVFDVTTIYKLQKTPTGATILQSGQILARGNARGIPLRRGNATINVASDDRCCAEWENDGWRKLTTKEALETAPVLDLTLRESAQEKGIRQTEQGWRGTLTPGQALRLDYTPPDDGFGFLAAILCDSVFPTNCYGLTFAGHADGRLRHYWMRYDDDDGDSGPFWVPGSSARLRASVESKDESIREGWVPVRAYTLQLELTPTEQLLVDLEGGDPSQGEELVFDVPGKQFKHLFIDCYKKKGVLSVQGETAWQGRVDAGKSLPLTWRPAIGGQSKSKLGVFLCTRPRADACLGALVSGSDGKTLRVEWARYGSAEKKPAWLPGKAGKATRKTVISSKETTPEAWTNPQYNMTLRLHGPRASLSLEDGATESWEVPVGYNYVVVASLKAKGLVRSQAAPDSLSTPGLMWPVWGLDFGRTEATLTSPPILAPPDHMLCLILVASVPEDGRLQFGFKGAGAGYRQITPVFSIAPGLKSEGWVRQRAVVDLPLDLVRRSDKIQLVLNATTSTAESVYIQVADVCDPNGSRDITSLVPDSTPRKKLFGFDVASPGALEPFEGKAEPCLHGGVLDKYAALCRCRPGFRGPTCEIGCGNNQFGADCKEACSDDTREGCSGLLVCGPGLPCGCASGFRGPTCDRTCRETKYGPNCEFTCGRCYKGANCDRYTGRCPQGCSFGFQPPLCRDQCGGTGDDFLPLINQGTAINITSFPWQAALYVKKLNRDGATDYNFICGGSLIRENLVLTAAHCVASKTGKKLPPQDFMVALGKTKSAWDAPEDVKAIKRSVYDIVVEQSYRGSSTYASDIAILILEQRAVFSESVTPVCLNWTPDNEIDLRAGDNGMLAGWGRMEKNVEATAETLQSAVVPVVARDDCFANLPNNLYKYITPDKLCAGYTKVPPGVVPSPARGDSGGGLCFQDKTKTWYVRGVVSVGLSELNLYTDVNHFQDFLRGVRDQVLIDEVRLKALVLDEINRK